MNKRLSKLLATVIITAMIISAIPMLMTPIAKALPALPAFWLLPATNSFDTNTNPLGFKFNVTLYGGNPLGIDVFAWQAEVDWDTSQIKADRFFWTNGADSKWFAGKSPITPLVTPIDNSTNPGTLTVGETLSGSDILVGPVQDTIVIIEFEITASPPFLGTLTSTISLNTANSKMLDASLSSIPGVSFGDASYSYQYASPPAPNWNIVGVAPYASNVFDMFTHWIGTTFDEKVYIENLAATWDLTNFTATFPYNNAFLQVTNVVLDGLWGGASSSTVNPTNVQLYVEQPSTVPNGNVLVATITLNITAQGDVPPDPYGTFVTSARTLTGVSAFSLDPVPTGSSITVNAPSVAPTPIIVYSFLHASPPWLSVSSPVLGPGPVVGTFFTVDVSINNVTAASQHLIGVQFRLGYDNTLIVPISVAEGPFFPYWASQEPGSVGTFFTSFFDPDTFGPNVLVGTMVYPDMFGVWHDPLPDGSGVIATITFQVIYQSFGEPNIVSPLNIVEQSAVGLDNMNDQNIVPVFLSPPINGTYTITTDWPGRTIDLYGGAVNSGWGPLVVNYISQMYGPNYQFERPYGGQGPNAPMDMVEPQSWVYLWVNVTYNYWPVQHKNVAFEIQEPDGTVYNKLSAFTDTYGMAGVGFRMPWPCDNPESLFGVWHITASVQLADVIINDTMAYHYDYMVHIWKVTTDKFQYNHNECVQIHFEYGSHAQQTYPVLFIVSIVDNLGVTVGIATVQTTVGGTVFCQYKNSTADVTICLPKWAYAGIATIHINGFDIEPAEGGVAITPEWVGPTIAIQPY